MTIIRSLFGLLIVCIVALFSVGPALAEQINSAYVRTMSTTSLAVSEVDWLALNRPVDRGRVLTLQDFSSVKITARTVAGLPAIESLIGKAAARPLQAGAVLRAGDVMDPQLVYRGSLVTVNVRLGGILITSSGRALNDAELGMPVRVLSNVSNRTLDAVAEGPGVVQLAGL